MLLLLSFHGVLWWHYFFFSYTGSLTHSFFFRLHIIFIFFLCLSLLTSHAGTVFINRSPKHFQTILTMIQHFNSPSLWPSLPSLVSDREELLVEADFYSLPPELMDALRSKVLFFQQFLIFSYVPFLFSFFQS